VLVVAPRWAAVLLAGSSVALISAYASWSTGPFPWRTVIPERGENATMLALSVVAWALFTVAAAVLLRRSFRAPPAGADAPVIA